ncbi:cell division protein FtsQ [Cytophagaceae bacterium DM2B3-1]|uniref:Cell division protein FtsQ n=1 Tax=Xanthocytophaga flava TaxID=3048013 RepID=A0ABT7CTR8_9BACT|nr:cell division protein FtsQ [Xanthocytophaga flavus]MDJ1468590.1 cell division protein FtsQ [Xanthocytophaga flavus]MDJ1496370.1 cell division protein FtsQ [Xanthocytophaga flavus]
MFGSLGKIKLRTPVKILAGALCFFILIGFVENKQHNKVCSGINIHIEDAYDTYFINDIDVLALLTNNGTERIDGQSFKEINLKNLELRLKTNKFVKSCQVYVDLMGKLNVIIQQNRPIARVTDSHVPDAYISEDGEILPLSERFTARVVLVEGRGLKKLLHKNLQADSTAKEYFELLQQIDNERFFKALITQVVILEDGTIQMYPQLGRQIIEFGTPTDIKRKFEKIRIFYQKVMPAQGWNRYRRVNVAYQNQIVCE